MLRSATAATAAVALALAAGCGGDDETDAEQPASYRVALPVASFPARQQLAHEVTLELAVRNTGSRTIPNVAATLLTGGEDGTVADAFSRVADDEGLASRTRPVWIVDEGPQNGETAFGNTWSLGSVAPSRTRVFRWRVVPVRAGRYTLRYRLFGSTTGQSRLRLQNGDPVQGSLKVRVSGKPSQVRVTPDGRVVNVPPT
jgi:hypothetical protein